MKRAKYEKLGAGGVIHDTRTLSLAQVAGCFPHIIQPPSRYFELQNKSGCSNFPPGMPSAFYQPFVDYFAERAQTCAAQIRLYRRKLKGDKAQLWSVYEDGWRAALRVAKMRQQRAIDSEQPLAAPGDRPPFEWDDDPVRPRPACDWSDETETCSCAHDDTPEPPAVAKLHFENAVQGALFK